jgi:hypothetical protein
MNENNLIDIQRKAAWLGLLALAANVILTGNGLDNEQRGQSIAVELMNIMEFISDEVAHIAFKLGQQQKRNLNYEEPEQGSVV